MFDLFKSKSYFLNIGNPQLFINFESELQLIPSYSEFRNNLSIQYIDWDFLDWFCLGFSNTNHQKNKTCSHFELAFYSQNWKILLKVGGWSYLDSAKAEVSTLKTKKTLNLMNNLFGLVEQNLSDALLNNLKEGNWMETNFS